MGQKMGRSLDGQMAQQAARLHLLGFFNLLATSDLRGLRSHFDGCRR
jgi:hypothetical protein